MTSVGPQTEIADLIHAMKYREENEDFREAMNRIAFGLKDNDRHYHEFREILLSQRFCPGGRIQSAIGSTKAVTAFNCYVSGTIEDSFTEGRGSIMQRAAEAAATMRMGGGIGYDFSTLRPRGDLIRKLHSQSSGPVSFMAIFNAVCLATSSSGHRRGAQMGMLRVDHPDIEEFVRAKQNSTALTGFNISVAVTDDFMEAVAKDGDFDLRFGGQVYRTIKATDLWEKIMRSTWDYAEPGIIFIDRINDMNNLYYCETIAATNPCSEQPLPPFGACLLGSFNLPKYLSRQPAAVQDAAAFRYSFDFDLLRRDIPLVVRAMDNVTDKTRYPLAEQRAEAVSKRRMGLGVMGLANCIEALGFSYGSKDFIETEMLIMGLIEREAYLASAAIAAEKGPFPLYAPERYGLKGHVVSLDDEVRFAIESSGIRNSHLTSVAPTGTISMAADNVSGGIEPVFSYKLDRPVNTPAGLKIFSVEDFGVSALGVRGKLAAAVTAEEHLNVLAAAQANVDSAVSKTVNMTGEMPWQDFKHLYQRAFELGCKGCATFNADGKRGALLVAKDDESESDICVVDSTTGQRDCG